SLFDGQDIGGFFEFTDAFEFGFEPVITPWGHGTSFDRHGAFLDDEGMKYKTAETWWVSAANVLVMARTCD
ncbi:MAG: hypothetical protein FWC40_09625, partial [Proteobacteria bacterium]|nr:hypothetical protein [Pseudomonadota bacterium]